MTKQMKVVAEEPKSRLVEVMQRTKLRFAFAVQTAEDEYTCIMPYVMCRDYLKDVCYVNYIKNGEGFGLIHGFDTSAPNICKQNKDQTILVITGESNLIAGIKKQWDYLQKIEEKLQVIPTQLLDVDDTHIIVVGDKRWQESLLAISYYSFLFRWMANNLAESKEDYNEWPLVKAAKVLAHIDSIDRINYKGFCVEQAKKDFAAGQTSYGDFPYQIHNYYGIYWLTPNYPELLDGTLGKEQPVS